MNSETITYTIVLAVVAIALSACGTTQTLPSSTQMPTGSASSPPPGWVDYCNRHPKDPSC